MRAYVRGQVISYNAGENKRKTKWASELIDRIKVETRGTSPSENLYRERISLQTEFDSLTNSNAMDLHLKSRHEFYEYVEPASRLLRNQLRKSATAGLIAAIKYREGNIVTDQRDVNAQFKSFYEDLYTSEAGNEELVEYYFSTLEMRTSDGEDKSRLERNIKPSLTLSAFKKIKSRKAPGRDWYPIKV